MIKTLLCCLFLCLINVFNQAQNPQKQLLQNSLSFEELKEHLLYQQEWVDYPAYTDRAAWDSLIAPAMREAVIAAGEKALTHVWKPDLASDYLAYIKTGEIRTGRDNHMALQRLTLAELVEGEGRFMEAIIDGTWFLCETAWIHSAHLGFQKDRSNLPDRDEHTLELVVGDIGSQMAWTYYFFHEEFDKVSLLINKRIVEEVDNRIIKPYFARSDYWWMGLNADNKKVNNWNIWINYNVLQVMMLMSRDNEQTTEGVWKLMRSSDAFIDNYKSDGACEEGPTYWGHAGANLLKFLTLLEKITNGQVKPFHHPLIQNIGQYLYRAHIGDDYFVNFADAAAKGHIKSAVVYEYGKRIGDPLMMQFAGSFLTRSEWPSKGPDGYFATALDEILISKELSEAPAEEPLIGSYWFEGTEVCLARDNAKSKKGFFFAAKGGNNDESHNHNDAGSFILYYDGKPAIVDAGVGVYTRKTFSSQRYEIWTMQSGYHNLPQINGVDQKAGRNYYATNPVYKENKRRAEFSVDIATAYPEEAAVQHWNRSYQLNKGRNFIVKDRWSLKNITNDSYVHLLTYCPAEVIEKGTIRLNGDDFKLLISYDANQAAPEIETIEFDDKSLTKSWSEGKLYRIRFKLNATLQGENSIQIKPEA